MAEDFYFVHKERPFFNDLCTYMSSGSVVVMVLEGDNAVLKNREIMGATNPKDAAKGTIRNLYGISLDKDENIVFQVGDGASSNIDALFGAYIKISPQGDLIWTTRISNTTDPDYSLGTFQ